MRASVDELTDKRRTIANVSRGTMAKGPTDRGDLAPMGRVVFHGRPNHEGSPIGKPQLEGARRDSQRAQEPSHNLTEQGVINSPT